MNMFSGLMGSNKDPAAQQMQPGGAAAPLKGDNQRKFLFCIPLQLGPATAYARLDSTKRWFSSILIVQFIVTICRLVAVRDIMGGIWMVLTVGVGAMAYREQMNITYVCSWGMLCLVNVVIDICTMVFTSVTKTTSTENGVLQSDTGAMVVHILVICVYLFGAAFARHLYSDYAAEEGLALNNMGGIGDPFGVYRQKLDQESRRLEAGQGYGATPPTNKEMDSMQQTLGPSATGGTQAQGPQAGAPAGGAAPAPAASLFSGGLASMSNAFSGAKAQASQVQYPGSGAAQAGQPPQASGQNTQSNPFLT